MERSLGEVDPFLGNMTGSFDHGGPVQKRPAVSSPVKYKELNLRRLSRVKVTAARNYEKEIQSKIKGSRDRVPRKWGCWSPFLWCICCAVLCARLSKCGEMWMFLSDAGTAADLHRVAFSQGARDDGMATAASGREEGTKRPASAEGINVCSQHALVKPSKTDVGFSCSDGFQELKRLFRFVTSQTNDQNPDDYSRI